MTDRRPAGDVRRRSLAATALGITLAVVVASLQSAELPRLRPGLAVIFALAAFGAGISGWLLVELGRIQDRPALRWVGAGNLATSLALGVQLLGFPGIAPGGGVLGTDSDGAAWLYLLAHATIPLAVLAGARRWSPRLQPALVSVTALAALAVAANRIVDVPDLFVDGDRYGGPLVLAMGALTVATLAAAAGWYRLVGDRPLGTEAWVGVSLLLHAADVGLHTFAGGRFTDLWWASLGMRSAQYVVLTAGLLVNLTNLHQDLHDYVDDTERHRLRLETDATRDFLTGLLNRRGLLHAAEPALARPGVRAAVLVIDLDGFKDVNDELGHEMGDEMLRNVSRAIEASVRGADLVARWGGDEFVVLLVDVDDAELAEVRTRVQDNVGAVSDASLGACVLGGQDLDAVREAIDRADLAMLGVKRGRRDRRAPTTTWRGDPDPDPSTSVVDVR